MEAYDTYMMICPHPPFGVSPAHLDLDLNPDPLIFISGFDHLQEEKDNTGRLRPNKPNPVLMALSLFFFFLVPQARG